MLDLQSLFGRIRAHALGHPEAYEESPWGELAIKVRKKVFVFLGHADNTRLSLSVKLPESGDRALALPQASPTGYGLGRHGWVSMGFADPAEVPLAQLEEWIEESYRAVAPKRLVKQLGEAAPSPRPAPGPTLDGRRLLLVGDDPLRLQRASKALVARAADVVCVPLAEALDAAGVGAPDAVVVDLSRNASQAIELLPDLGLVAGGHVVVAGIRSAKMERTIAALGGLAWFSREPPGEPAFVERLVGRLG